MNKMNQMMALSLLTMANSGFAASEATNRFRSALPVNKNSKTTKERRKKRKDKQKARRKNRSK